MTDPGPVKNPNRVPMSLQEMGDNVGTETGTGPGLQIVQSGPLMEQGVPVMSFKVNRDTGAFEVQVDGVYQNPATNDRFQFRKGHVVPEEVAKTFKRVGPWPGEVDENAVEAAETAQPKAAPAPENKAAPAPATKVQ